MPTVLRFDGLRVVIYPNDHRPAHVHVVSSSCQAVFRLGCPNGPVELRENYGFRSGEISEMKAELSQHLGELCQAWEEIHGFA
jgi:hypothetical protein